MAVYKRYFRFTDGPVVEEIDRLFEARIAAGKLYKVLSDKYGAESANTWESNGGFAGFQFKTAPDKSIYRMLPKHRLWVPRKNVPAGKEIWSEINQLPKPSPIEHALRLVDLEPGMPMLCEGGRWYGPALWGYGAPRNIWFVSVPWKDVDPEKLSEYKSIKEAGHGFDRDLEALMWVVPEGWTEVKSWQIEKECEEINSQEN